MLTFKKYSSIENTYDRDFMDRIKFEGYDSLQFVVQEKIHGSNCCFLTDGRDVQFAKRSGLVEAGEKFYDYEELLERYRSKIIRLFQRIKEKYADTENVMVYGEMFGGKYPHPDVKNDSKVMNIQKGVFYSPVHEFYGFDIFISETEKARYFSVDETNMFFEEENFCYAETLFRGTLNECLEYPNAFRSIIADRLRLPPIEDNVCEGVVIRPTEPVFFRNGARLLLKNKNAKFAEKKSVKKREHASFIESTYSELLKEQLTVVEEYIVENRLNNVVGKIGQISIPKETGKLIGLFSKDILDDYMKEHANDYALMEKSEQKTLNLHVNKQATNLIKDVYFNR